MNTQQLTYCLVFVAEGMMNSEPRLTELDRATGDGDHGIGIKRGFTALQNLLRSPTFTPTDIGDCLLKSGSCLMTSMGGRRVRYLGLYFVLAEAWPIIHVLIRRPLATGLTWVKMLYISGAGRSPEIKP